MSKPSTRSKSKSLGFKEMVTIQANYITDSEAGLNFEAGGLFFAPCIDGTQSGSINQDVGSRLLLEAADVIADPAIQDNRSAAIVVTTGVDQMLAQGIQQPIYNADCSDKPTGINKSSCFQLVNVLLTYSSSSNDKR